uniref:PHD and RING finger domain-containing protein 1-like n=1 Tax=Dermatophagoides pteronyssinus TaxID=6956 RepID=A0A6P6XZI9_DERPT|nr:putative uncharacterized protein DDB_G0277255 [Dermatophagoides pteronyssinus]
MMPLSPNSTPTCYICLNIFEGQDIGSPDSCETMHHFCLECIEEWGKQINTCPVDRKSFSFIIVRRTINGEIVMKVPIAKKSVLEIVTIDNDDVTYCEICGRCDREDRLLLCDGCDFGYHCECLVPPLETIPVDEWFCPDCFERLFGDDANEENNQRRLAQRRAIARTGTFERVRNRILARRSNVGTRTTKTKRKTKQRRRRRTTKKRKTTKTKTSNKTKTKRTRRRKYRKRTKKSKLSMKRLPAADPRSRLATRLGLVCKPKSPFGLPVSKPINQTRSLSEIRQFSGISGLSMFGYGLEMNHLSSYNDDLFDSGAVDGSSAGSLGLLTNTRHHIFVNNKSLIKTPTEPLSLQIRDSSNIDVLSEIMTSQEILHASSSDLSIARDGRVYLKAESSSSNNSIRQCPNNSSPNHSSSPPQSSSTNNGNSCKNHSSDRRSSLSGNSYLSSSSSSSSSSSTAHQERTTHTDNISFIKPSPVVSLTIDNDDDDKNIDIEMYSDIESLQDDNNKDLDENHPDDANDENDENHGNNQLKQPQEPVANIEDDKLLKIESDINQTQNLSESGEENSKNDTSIKNIETKVSKKSQQAKLKRRPSINDLFGDNSEDEDDRDEVNELKQLVAQQGGINVHFPIKMPIVLKTNFLSDKNKSSNNNDDDVPLSKKWVPIYPEMNETSKNSGPKWKAIGANSESNQKSKSESKEKFEKVHCDVDRKNEKSMNNNRPKLESKKQEISSKLQSSLRKVKDEENQDIFPDIIESVKIKKPVPKVKDETQTKIPTKQPDIKKNSPKNSTSSEAKIRTCKHGRPLAHKNKELSSSSTTTTSAAKRSKTIETTTSKPVHSKDYSSKKHEHSDLDYNHDDRYDRHRKFSKNEHPKLESKAIICPQPSSSSSNVKINQSSSNKNNNDNRLRDSSTKDESSSSAKKHRHHHHHHHHHRHHHRHKHDLENSSSGTISGHHHHSEEKKCVEKKSNLFQSYSKIDSKEIFAQGLYGL